MSDYDKLKLAHELCEKYKSETTAIMLTICYGQVGNCVSKFKNFTFNAYKKDEDDNIFESDDIDELILKLQELTKPKLNYEVGSTRQVLIEAQIDYWQPNQAEELEQNVSPCKHHWDSKIYTNDLDCETPKYKCKKCGEFY